MKKREAHHELIRLMAKGRLARLISYELHFELIKDDAYWRKLWVCLVQVTGWNKTDERRLTAVAKNSQPIFAGLTPTEQLAKLDQILAPGWETADQTSKLYRAMARVFAHMNRQPKPPDTS